MSNKKHLFKFTKMIMLLSGLWHIGMQAKSYKLKLIYSLYAISLQFFFSSMLVSFALEFCRIYSADFGGAVIILSRFIFILLLIVKMNLCRSVSMRQLLLTALKEERTVHANEDLKIEQIYNVHVQYCYRVIMAIFIATFTLFIYLSEIGIEASYTFYRDHKDSTEILDKPLPAPLWYPFDKNKHHICALSYQIIETFLTALYSGAVQALTNSITIFLRAQLKILQYQFTNFDNNELSDDSVLITLKKLCAKHQQLISWIKDLNESIKKILLLEYSISSLLIAAVLIQILQGEEVAFNTIYFSLIVGQLTMLSWNSDEIRLQSVKLSNALYNSKWYKQSPQVQALIPMIILRCQKPLTLSIGSFGPMTANTALSTIKLAYSYVSLYCTKTSVV